jgi:hypothetical protein
VAGAQGATGPVAGYAHAAAETDYIGSSSGGTVVAAVTEPPGTYIMTGVAQIFVKSQRDGVSCRAAILRSTSSVPVGPTERYWDGASGSGVTEMTVTDAIKITSSAQSTIAEECHRYSSQPSAIATVGQMTAFPVTDLNGTPAVKVAAPQGRGLRHRFWLPRVSAS